MAIESLYQFVSEQIAPRYVIKPIDIGQKDTTSWMTTDFILNETDGPVTGLLINSHKPGPLFVGVSGIHGDEGDGGAANLQTALLFRDKLLNGASISVLNTNPWACRAQQRIAPDKEFNQNLNTLFGIESPQTPLEQHASTLFNMIVKTINDNPEKGVVTDYHSEGRSDRSIPYIRIDRTDNDELQELLLCLGLVSGLPMVMEYADLKNEGLEHALSTALVRQGIPALTIEVGSGADLNTYNIGLATSAAERIGAFLKMLPDQGQPELKWQGLHQLANIYAYKADGTRFERSATLYLPEKFLQPEQVITIPANEQGTRGVGHLSPYTLQDDNKLQTVFPGFDTALDHDIKAIVISLIPAYQEFDPLNPLSTPAIPETDSRLLGIYQGALKRIFGTVD